VAETIEMIKPHIFAKGGDRNQGNIPEKEMDACRKVKCKIVCGVGGKTHSSSWYDWEGLVRQPMTLEIKPRSDVQNGVPLKVEKPWGFELVFAHTLKYAGKVIFVKNGHRLSLQYHNGKDETLYVQQGNGLLEIEGADGKLFSTDFVAGQCVRIPPRIKHRLKAVSDMTLLEVSTPELQDVVRLEDDYGRISEEMAVSNRKT
jgi:mannose-6-phosphate isomerase-like protein (cupin superfamily)